MNPTDTTASPPIQIRPETPADVDAIDAVHRAAFATEPHSRQTEHLIVKALRSAGALTVSLVAEQQGQVVGHAAASPVSLSDGSTGWHCVGPIGVLPGLQRRGIGSALMQALIQQLQAQGSAGCVLVGEPGYYVRFGFQSGLGLVWPGMPAEYDAYVQSLPFGAAVPQASVIYHPAFDTPPAG
ncbi:MAG: N-acetyltransferase [Hydrogenophaga sp.]|nr:N-acetyltransferase [Hydrogenophaga sp.]